MRTALTTLAAMLGASAQPDADGHDMCYQRIAWTSLRRSHADLLREQLRTRYAPATANKHLTALRGVLRACYEAGELIEADYLAASTVPPVLNDRVRRGRALSTDELARLLEACAADTSAAGLRDAAILALLAGTGLRRAEAVALDLADYHEGSGGTAEIRVNSGSKRFRVEKRSSQGVARVHSSVGEC